MVDVMSSDMAAHQSNYWKDLTVEEKLERMRQIIKNVLSDNQRLSIQMSEMNGKIANHDHKDGKVVVPMNPHSASLGGGLLGLIKTPSGLEREQKGEVYF